MSNWTLLNELKPYIQKNWEEAGFGGPTEIQEKALPEILQGKDCLCESPTGSGKTLAYLLPVIEKVDEQINNAQAIILAPSHELVMQIADEARKWSKGSNIKIAAFIGGANIKKQVEKLKSKPQIVIGTTGRIVELINMKKLKMHEVKTVVIDEADQLLAAEHINNVRAVIKATMRDRQILMFSATITKFTESTAKDILNEPTIIRVNPVSSLEHIDHLYFVCEQRDKIDLLRKIMNTNPGRTIAFIKSLNKLDEMSAKLEYHRQPVAVLAGESKKFDRKQAIQSFRSGKIPLLLTTDVAARGLDIEDVTHVIHFDFPSTTTQYLHRSGRTGRMGKPGTVISIVNAREESFLKKMSHELNIPFKKMQFYRGKMESAK